MDVGIEQPVDLAITHLDLPVLAARPARYSARMTRLCCGVCATGKDLNTTLTCKLDKKTYQQPVEVKAGETQTVSFEIDAQELKLGPGPHQAEVRLDPPDLLPFNNRRFATFAIREPRRVLVLTEDAGKAAYFVAALKANGFAVTVKATHDLPTLEPRPFEAIYLFRGPRSRCEVWGFLTGFVQQGIGLGIVPGGDELKAPAYNQEAAQKLIPGQLGAIVKHGKDDGKEHGAVWNLTDDIVYQHPFMRPFRDWKEYDVVKVPSEAFAFWEVKPHPKETLAVVAYKDDKKHPALLERRLPPDKVKPGKILLFTTPLDARYPRCHALRGRVAGQQLVHAPKDEWDDPGCERAGDRTGDEQPGRRAGQRRQSDGDRLEQEGQPQRATEADAVGECAGEQRPCHGAEAEHHPVAGAHRKPLVEEAGDEIDQEHHVRHQPGCVQPVLRQQCPHHPSHRPAQPEPRPRRERRPAANRSRPPRSGSARSAEPAPRRLQTQSQQQRHQRPGGRYAQSNAGEDQSCHQPSPSRIDMRQDCRCRQNHDHAAGQPAAKRQTKNHGNDSGTAQAKNAALASSIMARSRLAAGNLPPAARLPVRRPDIPPDWRRRDRRPVTGGTTRPRSAAG